MTLQECKDKVAKDNGYINWYHFKSDVNKYPECSIEWIEQSAELYKKSSVERFELARKKSLELVEYAEKLAEINEQQSSQIVELKLQLDKCRAVGV